MEFSLLPSASPMAMIIPLVTLVIVFATVSTAVPILCSLQDDPVSLLADEVALEILEGARALTSGSDSFPLV